MTSPDTDTPIYSIGSVARMLDISVQTLRLYESEGLILPAKSRGGQRRYSQADVERLLCIRRAITEQKISIAGIRIIQSLVPCWQIIKCSPEERDNCPAFRNHDGGCWTYRHVDTICAIRACRTCEVYRKSTSCRDIKHIIQATIDQP